MAIRWRLLRDGKLPGVQNMVRDAAILEAVKAGYAPPTLRLYGWKPACLSLGRHQGLVAADLGFCRERGIDVVRRPTGGRALLHHIEITYAVVAPLGEKPIPRQLQEAYWRICEPLLAACRAFGIRADLAPGEVNLELPGPASTVPCFQAPAGGEVMVGGRKLIGSAMRAHGDAVLQHGAILLNWDRELQAGSMGLPDDSALREQVTTFAEQIGRVPSHAEMERVLKGAFEDELGIELEEGVLTDAELRAEEAFAGRFEIR